jgi:hypothetical protein
LRGSSLATRLKLEIALSDANSDRLRHSRRNEDMIEECANDLETEYVVLKAKLKMLRRAAQGSERRFLDRLRADLDVMGTSFHFKWQERIKRLAKRFAGYQYGPPITEESIRRWLGQFRSPIRMECALHLLDNLEVVSFEAYTAAVRAFDQKNLAPANRRLVYADLLVVAESTPILQSIFRKAMQGCGRVVNAENCAHIKQMLSGKSPLFMGNVCLLADDIIGSGKQYVTVLKALLDDQDLNEKDKAKYFARQQRLGRVLGKRFSELEGYLVVYAACACGLEKVASFFRERCSRMTLATLFGRTPQKCFEANQNFRGERLFQSNEELRDAMSMCCETGRQLWNEENALGFEDSQQLIVFSHNIPNNTLPIFWKRGLYNGQPWVPLFERPGKG